MTSIKSFEEKLSISLEKRLKAAICDYQPTEMPLAQLRPASVVLILQPGESIDLWFVRRSRGLRQHAGQIAFPGGKEELDDGGPWPAAAREAFEEIGAQGLLCWGQLDDCWTPTGYRIRPFVAWNQGPRPGERPSGEVESAFCLPIEQLLQHEGPTFASPQGEIWGATARILQRYLQLVRGQEA